MMLCSVGSMSVTHGQEINITRLQAVKIIQDLIACDYIQKEVNILLNTIETKDNMLVIRKEQVNELSTQIEKRDTLIDVYANQIEVQQQMISNLSKQIDRLDRRRKVNKWVYFLAGAGVGYLVAR